MRIGTKSVLFGVHQFLLHPLLIALGWWKEYGWRRVAIGAGVRTHLLDPRLWLAFFVHDLGYLGKPNMDGEDGETHPEFGARVMRLLFGAAWGDFVLLHSRYYSKRLGLPVSALAMADKWVIVLEPSWLYLPRAWASGELAEYLEVGAWRADVWQPTDAVTHEEAMGLGSRRPLVWHRAVKAYMRRWIAEHRDGRQDTWTRRRHWLADVERQARNGTVAWGVTQTITGDDGNCLEAALATILDVAIEDVPRFHDHEWWGQLIAFLATRGLACASTNIPPKGLSVAVGESPRKPGLHAVVAVNGRLAFDPHPTRAFFKSDSDISFIDVRPLADMLPLLPEVRAEDLAILRRKQKEGEAWTGPQRDCPSYQDAMARSARVLAVLEAVQSRQEGR